MPPSPTPAVITSRSLPWPAYASCWAGLRMPRARRASSSRAFAVDGCTVDVRAYGTGVTDEAVAGVIAGGMAVRGGGRVVAVATAATSGVHAYGVYLIDAGGGVGPAGCRFSVDASWLDATGAVGGVGCAGGSLVSARFAAPAGETDGREVPGGSGEPAGGTGPTVEQPGAGTATGPVPRPAATTPKTTTPTKTIVTKTTASKAKTASAANATLPKTADSNWIAASLALFLLGTGLLGAARCC